MFINKIEENLLDIALSWVCDVKSKKITFYSFLEQTVLFDWRIFFIYLSTHRETISDDKFFLFINLIHKSLILCLFVKYFLNTCCNKSIKKCFFFFFNKTFHNISVNELIILTRYERVKNNFCTTSLGTSKLFIFIL